jgi:hypothetical protein
MHNTLAASDYGLLDERTLEPRPDFWGALLWRRLMGNVVLDPGARSAAGLGVYAHCQRGVPGGVSLLVINIGRRSRLLVLPAPSERYTLDAADAQDKTVRLNGIPLRLGTDGDLPRIASMREVAGALTIAPATINFLTIPEAANEACR